MTLSNNTEFREEVASSELPKELTTNLFDNARTYIKYNQNGTLRSKWTRDKNTGNWVATPQDEIDRINRELSQKNRIIAQPTSFDPQRAKEERESEIEQAELLLAQLRSSISQDITLEYDEENRGGENE